ncbi:MAG: alginate export family protein [Acidobacteriota bacterium]
MKKLMFATILALGALALMAPPAMAADDGPFTIHGEVRFRGEYQTNAKDFDDDAVTAGPPLVDDQALYFPYRVRIAAEGKLSKNVAAWLEFQNANVAGDATAGGIGPTRSGIGGEGSDVELYQGNITLNKLWSDSFSLRIGRQEIVAGNELLLGDLDFYTGISHDGGVGMWDWDNVSLMVWYTRPDESLDFFGAGPLPPDLVSVGGFRDQASDFLGGYASWTWANDQNFDVYAMSLDAASGGVNVQTIGARYAHDTTDQSSFIWNVELAQQLGDSTADPSAGTDRDAEGRAIEAWFGYNWKAGRNVHRVYARLEVATGDDTSDTDADEGFIPMFGDFHNRLGRGDWFQLADTTTSLGGTAVGGGVTATAIGYNGFYQDRHEFGAQLWNYTLEEDNGGADDLGTAVDVWYGFNYSRNVNFVVSLSQLSPDDALTGGGTDDEVMRLYGQARLRF